MNFSFSLITPSYNRGSFIEKTIQSVLGQSYSKLSYLVVDGQSTDNTLDILEKYKDDERFDYVSEPDNGMYDAINKGISRCSGDIIAYINTDDLLFPWSIEKVNSFFAAHDDVDIVYGDMLVIDTTTGRQQLNIYPDFSARWLKSGALLAQPTVFMRKALVNKVGLFGRNVRLLGDCEYWLRCLEHGAHFSKIHEFLAVELNHEGTLRETRASEVSKEREALIDKYGQDFPKILRKIMLRRKYIEKEWLTLQFLWTIQTGKVPTKWRHFLEAYNVHADLLHYFGNKLVRSNKNVWSTNYNFRP